MTPETRFYTAILTLTIIIMFTLITLSQTFLVNSGKTGFFIGMVSSLLASAGIYNLLATILRKQLKNWIWLKKMILGPYFLEGTWMGYLKGKKGDKKIVIEHHEQNPFELIIRGASYTLEKEPHAVWNTNATYINIKKGMLYCFYNTKILKNKNPVEGIGDYQFIRKSPDKPCDVMTGYVIDTDNGISLPIEELIKISDKIIPYSEVLSEYL